MEGFKADSFFLATTARARAARAREQWMELKRILFLHDYWCQIGELHDYWCQIGQLHDYFFCTTTGVKLVNCTTTGVNYWCQTIFFKNNRVSFLKKVDAFQMLRMSKGNYRISYTSFEGRLGSLPSAAPRRKGRGR